MGRMARSVVLGFGLIVLGGCTGLSPQYKVWLAEGKRAYERRQYPRAIQRLSLVVNNAQDLPGLARALYLRGMSHAKSGQRSLAFADLRRCVGGDPDPDVAWKAHAVLGTLYFEEQQFDAAARAYEQAAALMPGIPPVGRIHFQLGRCYERSGRWGEAQIVFRRIAERYPFSGEAAAARRRLALRPTHFAVQCGAFQKASNAENFRSELERQGLAAYVREEPRRLETLHIVLVGRYATYAASRQGLADVRQFVPDAVPWP